VAQLQIEADLFGVNPVEEIAAGGAPGHDLEVDEWRFDAQGIRNLYNSSAYPLA
jgi:hypothetical protein